MATASMSTIPTGALSPDTHSNSGTWIVRSSGGFGGDYYVDGSYGCIQSPYTRNDYVTVWGASPGGFLGYDHVYYNSYGIL